MEEIEFSEAEPAVAAETPAPAVEAAPAPLVKGSGSSRIVAVTVRPLVDLGIARAVESSLNDSEGIENARLSSLSGDTAVIDAHISPGVSVISALRKSLPVAFNVTDTSEDSVTIEMAVPEGDDPETTMTSEPADS